MTFATIGFEDGQRPLDWLDLCQVLKQAHTLQKAQISDTFLYWGTDTLLSRSAWISGLGWLCRKVFQRLSEDPRWTQLSSEGRKQLERRHIILPELSLADHVCGFDPSQCCSC